MALIDEVAQVCGRLAGKGWRDLLLAHGLDIGVADLRAELSRPLAVNRDVPGFGDFAAEGVRGIEPGSPARSLLYHALASPHVVNGADGRPLGEFPSWADLDKVENLVFGMVPPSMADLQARANGGFLAIAVFATEYRPGPSTVHRAHADMCFARTGVARIGNAPARYEPSARGFLPVGGGDHDIRVLPARYAAYVAVQHRPADARFGPMNLDLRRRHRDLFRDAGKDDDRLFWVPLHKLFSGTECVNGETIRLSLETFHVNQKLRRVHKELAAEGHDTGFAGADLDRPPFIFTDGIAGWSKDRTHGPGVVVPEVHAKLIDPATFNGRPLAFKVPASPDNGLGPSLTISSTPQGFRHAPEYVHVRSRVADDGSVHDLNDETEVGRTVFAGGYRALHYVDHTGDGWVQASVPELAVRVPRRIPAYSVVTAPDFYPRCDQRELMEWWVGDVPSALRAVTWQTPPLTLSDERVAPNLTLPRVDFRPEDDTVTAIVSLPLTGPVQARPLGMTTARRSPHLPDAAAGVFAPGWDTSQDQTNGTAHLAAYGLGSPFPEDAKLCAALSTFWPAVAPDAGRSFSTTFPTVSPLDDTEIGTVGGLPWDGIAGPRLVAGPNGSQAVEYASFDHVDYVRSALDGRFSLARTGQVTAAEYEARVLAMARAYLAAGITNPSAKRAWGVLSFRAVAADDADLVAAQAQAGSRLQGRVWGFELFRRGEARRNPDDHRLIRVAIAERVRVLVGALPGALVRRGQGPWALVRTP